jgi:hypothetical protein
LRQELQRQSRVNYVIIATVPEPWAYQSNLQVITLTPLKREDVQEWVTDAMDARRLKFEMDALDLFLDYVRGHLGDAIALARRIWLEHRIEELGVEGGTQDSLDLLQKSEQNKRK